MATMDEPQPGMRPQAPTLRVMQMLVAMLIMGLVIFSGVVVFLMMTGAGPSPRAAGVAPMPVDLLLTIMGVLTVVCAIGGFVVAGMVRTNARKKAEAGETFDEPNLLAQFQVITIMRAALAEGPALLGTVIVLISGNWLGFAGTAFGLGMLLFVVFPTRGRFEGFALDVTGRRPGM